MSSVNGQTGAVSLTIPTVPTDVSAFNNDAGYLTSYTETDPTVPSWAKAASKPTYTASEVGALAATDTDKVHIINLTYYNTIDDTDIYTSTEVNSDIKTYIDNKELVVLKISNSYYYFTMYDRGLSDMEFIGGFNNGYHIIPYKMNNSYTNYWRYDPITRIDNDTTYTLSMSSNRITLTPSSGSATYVDLPVYDGSTSATSD